MRKQFFLLLTVIICGLTSFSQTIVRHDNLLYQVWEEDNNPLAEILGNTILEPIHLEIPSEIMYEGKEYNVISIGQSAFESTENILSVTVPQGIVSIKDNAFYGCRKLENIELPIGLSSIGERAFTYCYSLQSIILPCTVTQIAGNAFEWCGILRAAYPDNLNRPFSSIGASYSRVTVPYPSNDAIIDNGVIFSIDKKTIYYASDSVVEFIIPDGVEKIGDAAFANCDNIKEIVAPPALVEIGNYSFQYCKQLSEFKCESNIMSIGNFAFTGCENLKSFTLSNALVNLGVESFSHCSKIESIIIPESLTSIKSGTFRGCSNLSYLTIPNTIESIEGLAFNGCLGLKDIYYLSDNPIETEKNIFSNETYLSATLYVNPCTIEKVLQISPWLFFAHIEENNINAGISECEIDQDVLVYDLNGNKLDCNTIDVLSNGFYIVKQGPHIKKILKRIN